jgi:nicotinamidase-related amidase
LANQAADSQHRKESSLAKLAGRPHAALVVIDMQNGVIEGGENLDQVVVNIASLVNKARQDGVCVIWVQHFDESLPKGSDEWQLIPALIPLEGEPLIEKSYPDSFEDTPLEAQLDYLGVGKLVVVGAQTDACVLATLHGAFIRGYDATLISDAHTTVDQTEFGGAPPSQVIAHINLYWNGISAPGRTASTVTAGDFAFSGMPG